MPGAAPTAAAVATAPVAAAAAGWLRGARFDLLLTLGTAALGLAAGGLVALAPALFAVAMFADLWLLAYPHVASTFTRLVCDRESFARHRLAVFALPFATLAAAAGLARAGGLVALVTVYYHWQLFHYARQAHGIDRVYARRAPRPARPLDDALARWVLGLVPLAGLLRRAHQQPARFGGQPIAFVPVPGWTVAVVVALALAAIVALVVRQVTAPRDARMSAGRALSLASSVAVMGVGYLVVEDIGHGWLVANVWHNAQYLLFVWLFNSGRFRRGEDPAAPWLSRMSQPSQWPRYALALFGASTVFYFALANSVRLAGVAPAVLLVLQQTVNFHHYVVDALVWKVRRPVVGVVLTQKA